MMDVLTVRRDLVRYAKQHAGTPLGSIARDLASNMDRQHDPDPLTRDAAKRQMPINLMTWRRELRRTVQ